MEREGRWERKKNRQQNSANYRLASVTAGARDVQGIMKVKLYLLGYRLGFSMLFKSLDLPHPLAFPSVAWVGWSGDCLGSLPV